MIERLNDRVRDRGLANVTVVRAAFDDPGLPEGCCDLVFLSSVYKEIEGRVAYMRRVQPLLRPGGRVAILEFRPGAPGWGPPEAMRLAPEAIVAELGEAGFVLVESHDFLPRESFLVFAYRPPMPLREGRGSRGPPPPTSPRSRRSSPRTRSRNAGMPRDDRWRLKPIPVGTESATGSPEVESLHRSVSGAALEPSPGLSPAPGA